MKSIQYLSLKKELLSLVILLLSQSIFALTEHSELIKYIQEKYADQGQNYPILIIDQDEIEFRYLNSNAFGAGDKKEKLRVKVLQNYIYEQTGIKLSDQKVLGLEPYTTVLKNDAYALPVFENYNNKYKICTVFPASPNSNQKLEIYRFLALNTTDAYPKDVYKHLKKHIPYSVLKMYSILHELGHCLDQSFLPKAYASYEADAHSIHKSESFAEVFSSFMLIKEGYKNWAQTRALYRNLYTRYMGAWFINNPQNGFGNPLYLKGGIIYYLTPPLLQADYVINKQSDLKDLSVLEYIELSERIVQQEALSSRSFQGVFKTFQEKHEDVVSLYRSYAFEYPGLFKKAYQDILEFLDFSPYLETKILDFRQENNLEEIPEDIALGNISALQAALEELIIQPQQGSRTYFDDMINTYRTNLEQASSLNYQSLTKQKALLDSLYSDISIL